MLTNIIAIRRNKGSNASWCKVSFQMLFKHCGHVTIPCFMVSQNGAKWRLCVLVFVSLFLYFQLITDHMDSTVMWHVPVANQTGLHYRFQNQRGVWAMFLALTLKGHIFLPCFRGLSNYCWNDHILQRTTFFIKVPSPFLGFCSALIASGTSSGTFVGIIKQCIS